MKTAVALLKATCADWTEDKASRLAAALAFYTVFSIAPLLIIAVSVAAMVLGDEAPRHIIAEIQGIVGPNAAEAIADMVKSGATQRASGLMAAVGFTVLLFGAAGVFGALQDALNTIWEVQPKPDRGFLGTVKDRFLSVTGSAFLLLVSMLLSAALAAAGKFVGDVLPVPLWALQVLNVVVSLGVITVLFAMIFKYLPDVKIGWSDVWIGALLTATLFVVGKFALGFYLGRASVSSAFGAAGSLVVLLLWVYYAAQILFFGAEFTQVYANRFGTRVEPAENAMPVTEEARAQQGMPARTF